MEDMKTTLPGGMQDSMPSRSGRGGMLKTLLIIIVVLLVIWGLYSVFSNSKGPSGDEQDYTVESAAPGEVVSDFPEELLPEEGVAIQGSYVLKYSGDGGTLPTVEYTSGETLESNIAIFMGVFADNGWTVTKEASLEETPTTNIYAVKGASDANVTLSQTDTGVRVHIAYIERK